MFNTAANAAKYETTGGGRAALNEGKNLSFSRRGRGASILFDPAFDHENSGDNHLHFTTRQLPLTPATRGGFFIFIVFLAAFSWITVMERNDHVYYFAEHTRQLVGVTSFRQLEEKRQTYREYQTWFTYHFMDGLANVSSPQSFALSVSASCGQRPAS